MPKRPDGRILPVAAKHRKVESAFITQSVPVRGERTVYPDRLLRNLNIYVEGVDYDADRSHTLVCLIVLG